MRHGPKDLATAHALRGALREVVVMMRGLDHTEALSTSQSTALTALREGPRTMGELARIGGMRLPSATSMVRRLADAGYVTRTRDEADQRVQRVHLTEEGRAALAASDERRAAYLADAMATLSATEREALAAAAPALQALAAAAERP
ncbi:MarR family transcriptional regulator [Kytococcus sp. HMSC28H12]|uniref:MarR family transcriptional regulator n=1 Tax=Kytococcus sp. HMSC28H12 TaxID=1581067 RepID=UPI0008A5ADC0|nr:MarR family transcriptional regulator [Kytococcus sp. HMSC28H12]